MAREKKPVHKYKGQKEYDIESAQDIQNEPQVDKSVRKICISMYAKGMTTRQISDVTDKIMPQIEDWQNRSLSEAYPVLYFDAIRYLRRRKLRGTGTGTEKWSKKTRIP